MNRSLKSSGFCSAAEEPDSPVRPDELEPDRCPSWDELNERCKKLAKVELERDLLKIKYEGLLQWDCTVGNRYLICDGDNSTAIVTMTDRVENGDRVFQYGHGACRIPHSKSQRFFPVDQGCSK